MGHRRFLPRKHRWRKRVKDFDGKEDMRSKPKRLSGDDILTQIEAVKDVKFGKRLNNKKMKLAKNSLNWRKKSIFFELSYWRH